MQYKMPYKKNFRILEIINLNDKSYLDTCSCSCLRNCNKDGNFYILNTANSKLGTEIDENDYTHNTN